MCSELFYLSPVSNLLHVANILLLLWLSWDDLAASLDLSFIASAERQRFSGWLDSLWVSPTALEFRSTIT